MPPQGTICRSLSRPLPLFYLSNVFNYYLRNDGSQRRAGAGSVIGNLCDIALNITLVLALDMGTRGAALSTALGQIITIAIYLPGFFGQKHTLRFALPRGRWLVPALSALKAGMGHLGAVPVPDDLLPRVQQSADPSGRRNGGGGVRRHSEYLLPDLYLFEGTGRAMQPSSPPIRASTTGRECGTRCVSALRRD